MRPFRPPAYAAWACVSAPKKVAATVWRAAHGKKLHWKIGATIRVLMFGMWALPFARRFLVKTLTFSNGHP